MQLVLPASTNAVVSSPTNSAAWDQSVTLTAAIAVIGPATGIPTLSNGTTNVTFMDGTNSIAGTVSYKVVNWTLAATLTTSALSVGTHAITAVYSGDDNFLGSTSEPFKLQIVVANSSSHNSSPSGSKAFRR